MTVFTAACLQTNSGLEVEPNIAAIRPMIHEARERGADFITMPENATMVDRKRRSMLPKAQFEEDHPAIPAFARIAAETGAWILAGSLTIKLPDEEVANRSYLFDASGEVVARYDKIHMFDVDLASGERYRESSYVRSGGEAVLAPTPWGLLGMTVCYDLRFAALYRALAQAGASFLTVPAAFTQFTGKAHWHVLLRARAIENQVYVVAPNQVGPTTHGPPVWGGSAIVGPWGSVLARAPDTECVITAEFDPKHLADVRVGLPCLEHARLSQGGEVDGRAAR